MERLIRVMRPRTARTALVAIGFMLAGTTAIRAEEVTLKNQVDLLDDKTAAGDVVETVPRDAKLQVIGREDKWVHVKAADGKDGWISEAVLSANAGGGLDLSGLLGGSQGSEMSSAAAGKGFDDSVETYARNKSYSKAGLDRMIAIRKSVKGADWRQFVKDGGVGAKR